MHRTTRQLVGTFGFACLLWTSAYAGNTRSNAIDAPLANAAASFEIPELSSHPSSDNLISIADKAPDAADASVANSKAKPVTSQHVAADETPQGISGEAWAGIQQQIAQAQYEAAPMPSDPGTVSAHNPKQDLQLSFTGDGARLESLRNRDDVSPHQEKTDRKAVTGQPASLKAKQETAALRLQTLALSRGEQRQDAETVQPVSKGARIEYRRSGWTEWFVNGAAGLEHGYTLDRRPLAGAGGNGESAATLHIALAVRGMTVGARLDDGLSFTSLEGQALGYGKLVVTDADGRMLPARLATTGEAGFEIAFEDSAARYPVTVDPLLVNETQVARNPSDDTNTSRQQTGYAVALGDRTLLVGAPTALGYGAVYVYVSNSAGIWRLQQRLTVAALRQGDQFGDTVALSGDTAMVGTPGVRRNGSSNDGRAYIFQRSNGRWRLQTQLNGEDSGFAASIALSGDTAVVGAPGATRGRFVGVGAAHVFFRSGSEWTLQARLQSAVADTWDGAGGGVAIDGDTILVGAANAGVDRDGLVFTFRRTGTAWTEGDILFRSGTSSFGDAVALSGDTAIITSLEDASVFVRLDGHWSLQSTLNARCGVADNFGFGSVAVLGDTALLGLTYFGTVCVFTRTGTTWTAQSRLIDGNGPGFYTNTAPAVALYGDTAVAGEPADAYSVGSGKGAAYVFMRSRGGWTEQARLAEDITGPAFDMFGTAVAVSGDIALVGVPRDDIGGNTDQGSAYVFTRSGVTWTQQFRLTGSGSRSGGLFGESIALSGDTAVIGASGEDGAVASQGVAYVFVRTGAGWSQQARLMVSGASNDRFGAAVALSGETALVGAPGMDGTISVGAAFVFVRAGTSWTLQAALATGLDERRFGRSVALSGETALVGSLGDRGIGASVFVRSGRTWTPQASWACSSCTVALYQDTALTASYGGTGAAVHVRSGTNWTQQAILSPVDALGSPEAVDSVALAGDLALLGSSFDFDPRNGSPSNGRGLAFLFLRSGAAWTQQARLMAADGASQDRFGASVALTGAMMLVGAPLDDLPGGADGGSVHFFRIGTDYGDAPAPYPTLVADNGARHFINTDGPYLGSGIDAETDGQPSNTGATGDDIAGSDDEDGVTFGRLRAGKSGSVTVVVTAPAGTAQLDAWLDLNADGDWSDAGEQIFRRLVVNNGTNTLSFAVPATATPGQTYARFRLSPAGTGGTNAIGRVIFGEVEDYIVNIRPIQADTP